MRKVSCYVVGLDDKQAYEISLVENLQRKNLNPIEEARAFKRYVDERGYGAVSELAIRIGKSEPYVSKRLALLELPGHLQEQLIRRRITRSTAEELISLDHDEIREVTEQLPTNKVTRAQVRSAIKRMRRDRLAEHGGLHQYQEQDESLRRIERARSKCIASMSLCLTDIDDAIQSLGEGEWFVRENLIVFRRSIHQFIDNIIVLRRQRENTINLVEESTPRKSTREPVRLPDDALRRDST